MHQVVVVASHGVVPFDLSTPTEIFRGTRLADGRAPYRLTVCGVARSVETADFTLRLRAGLEALARADTVIVPGVADLDRPVPRELVQALRAAAARGARLASICSGAFLLAATGLAGGQARHHALARGRRARPPLPVPRGRSERALRGRGQPAHVGRRDGGDRPVPAPRAPRLRSGGRRQHGADVRGGARARGRAGAVHRPPAAPERRRVARAAARVDRAEPGARAVARARWRAAPA